MMKMKGGEAFFPDEQIPATVETTQETVANVTISKLDKGAKKINKDVKLTPVQEAIKNLDVTSFLAEASKYDKNSPNLPEELQAFLKYGIQLLITNPTGENFHFLLGKLSELGADKSKEGNLTAALLASSILGAAKRLHKEGFTVPTPDPEQINQFIRERTDLINQLSNSGITPEELNSKSNAELKLLLAKRQLEG